MSGILAGAFITASYYYVVRILGAYYLINHTLKQEGLYDKHVRLTEEYDPFSFSTSFNFFAKHRKTTLSTIGCLMLGAYTLYAATTSDPVKLTATIATEATTLTLLAATRSFLNPRRERSKQKKTTTP